VDWDVLKWRRKFPYNYPAADLDEWPGDHREWEQYKPKKGNHY
jgi:hypothetical protein